MTLVTLKRIVPQQFTDVSPESEPETPIWEVIAIGQTDQPTGSYEVARRLGRPSCPIRYTFWDSDFVRQRVSGFNRVKGRQQAPFRDMGLGDAAGYIFKDAVLVI